MSTWLTQCVWQSACTRSHHGLAAYDIGCDEKIDLDRSRHELDDDREGEPKIGEGEPREHQVEQVVLLVSLLAAGRGPSTYERLHV